MDMNWLSPMAQTAPAGGKGWGAFAKSTIPAGTTIAAFGGFVVDRATLNTFADDRQSRSIQIDDDLFLVSSEVPEPGDMFNHSCEPTCGLLGATLVVTMREVQPGEELTFDYATCDTQDYDEFYCQCGLPTCRGTITGRDWMLPELQDKYEGWFSPYIARRIAGITSTVSSPVGLTES
jgi:SET domain-containing protein